MKIYIFDTDHLSLYGRANPYLIAKLQATQIQLYTTVINVEEQLRGRLAQISEIKRWGESICGVSTSLRYNFNAVRF